MGYSTLSFPFRTHDTAASFPNQRPPQLSKPDGVHREHLRSINYRVPLPHTDLRVHRAWLARNEKTLVIIATTVTTNTDPEDPLVDPLNPRTPSGSHGPLTTHIITPSNEMFPCTRHTKTRLCRPGSSLPCGRPLGKQCFS